MRTYFIFYLLSVSGWAGTEALSPETSTTPKTRQGVKLIDRKVSAGVSSSIEENPYQVSFKIDNAYYCGGVLVSEKDIITPAHCTYGVSPHQVVLRAGSSFYDDGVIIPVADVVTHPGYNEPAFDKDVGFIVTAEPVLFSKTIQPIALPPKSRPLTDEVFVVGWGRSRGDVADIPGRVMRTLAYMYDDMRCKISYPTLMTRNKACSSNFYLGEEVDCKRDTEGAAIQDGMVVGLVTFTGVCGHESSPSVFADLAAPEIHDFISSHLGLTN